MIEQTAPARTTRAGAAAATAPDALFAPALAKAARVDPRTITQYLWAGEKNRRDGQPRPRDLPAPDGYLPDPRGGKPLPWWRPDTAAPWLAARQGPGRPPKAGGKPRARTPRRARPGRTPSSLTSRRNT
jgi:hypothetical protein